MSIENKKFLGWGLVGTPKGRQQLAEGATAQLQSAKYYDLEQDIGNCLPSPLKDDGTALYCVSFRQVSNHETFGIAEYHSVFEQGQTRAGTFYGSFIETVNSVFGQNALKEIFVGLFKLSHYQTEHFIDANTKSYKESIAGKSFSSPHAELDNIALALQPLPKPFEHRGQNGNLYIQYNDRQEMIDVLNTILDHQLYYYFNKIYFSASEYISQQMENKKVVFHHLSAFSAVDLVTQPLHQHNHYLMGEIEKKNSQLAEVQSMLKYTQENQENLIEQRSQERVNTYRQQAVDYQQQYEKVEQEKQRFALMASYGSEMLQKTAEIAGKIGREDLSQFAPLNSNNREERLSSIQNSLATIAFKLDNLQPDSRESEPPVQVDKTPVYLAWIFGLCSLLMFIVMLISIWSSWDDVSAEEHDKVKKEVFSLKQEKSTLESEIDALKNKPEKMVVPPAEESTPQERKNAEEIKAKQVKERKNNGR